MPYSNVLHADPEVVVVVVVVIDPTKRRSERRNIKIAVLLWDWIRNHVLE